MNTYITNNCGCLSFYFNENREYDHPFIGCLFVNDLEYVKFCKNFYTYIKSIPKLGLPSSNSIWCKQSGNKWYQHVEIKIPYPVLYIGDSSNEGNEIKGKSENMIELHYIHETDGNILLETYKRRQERLLNNLKDLMQTSNISNIYSKYNYPYDKESSRKIIFMFSCADLCNNHTEEERQQLIKEFTSIPNSIYLSRYPNDITISNNVYFVKEWENGSKDRNTSFITDIHTTIDRMKEYKKYI